MPKITKYLLYCSVAFFVVLTILKSFYFSNKNGGVDLRIRAVASRLLATDHSPYFYKWNPEDGEYLLDPNDHAGRVVNGNVVTPAILYVIYPVSWQYYPTVRLLWTVIQFILCFLSLFLLLKTRRKPWPHIPVSFILLGLICTDIWLLNIGRGQIYIFYTFLFATIYRLYTSNGKYSMFFSGFMGGLFILFRPFAGIIALVLLLSGKRKWIIGCVTGFILGCFLFVLPQPSLWKDYFKAMNEYANEYTGISHFAASTPEYEKPGIIEGVNSLTHEQRFNIGGLDTIYSYLKKMGILISKNQSYLAYFILVILLCIIFFRFNRKDASSRALFLFAFLLYILAELFVMAPRNPYNIIQWLFPLSLIFLKVRFNQPSFVLLVVGLLLLHNFPFVVPYLATLAELLFIGVVIYSIFFIRQSNDFIDNQLTQ